MSVLPKFAVVGLLLLGAAGVYPGALAQDDMPEQPLENRDDEADYYSISTIPVPDSIVLEVTGMAAVPDGRLAVATRRGEVWMIRNPSTEDGAPPGFERFAHGLHEPMGLAYTREGLYAAQRGELTRLRDTDGDGRADRYETVYSWPQSGNHHAFSYGPEVLPDGRLWVGFGLDSPADGQTREASLVPWRGWAVTITPDGEMTPMAAGMKQPSGYGLNTDGDLFYAEHDGRWIGSGWITHVEKGDFMGHPASLRWKDHPGSPLTDVRQTSGDIPSSDRPMYEYADRMPAFKLPSVWFPDGIMGTATEDILVDSTGGAFGPFAGHLFVGDHGHDKLMRVFLEKVKGVYQGAVFPFRNDLAPSGVFRQAWGAGGAMFVGMTSRGWAKSDQKPFALQRVKWTGRVPFEMKAIRARPDGLELEFTRPVDPASARMPSAYQMTSFTYKYHEDYGSPVIRKQQGHIRAVEVSDDSMRVRLALEGMRRYYIHEIKITGDVRSRSGMPLLHTVGYYTLNNVPEGENMAVEKAVVPADESDADTAGSGAQTGRADEPADGERRVSTMPASWSNGPDLSITIGTRPGLEYDRSSIRVPAGARVALTFDNDDDMTHNLVVVRPGTATAVGERAMEMGLDGAENQYIPESDSVLYHTSLLQPDTSETIYFTAPQEPGDYTYVCTFPGHYVTMRGTMEVVAP